MFMLVAFIHFISRLARRVATHVNLCVLIFYLTLTRSCVSYFSHKIFLLTLTLPTARLAQSTSSAMNTWCFARAGLRPYLLALLKLPGARGNGASSIYLYNSKPG